MHTLIILTLGYVASVALCYLIDVVVDRCYNHAWNFIMPVFVNALAFFIASLK